MNHFYIDLICPACKNQEKIETDEVPGSFLVINSVFHVDRDKPKTEEIKLYVCRKCGCVHAVHPWLIETKSS